MFSQLGGKLGKQGKKLVARALNGRAGRAGAGKRLCLVSDSRATISPTADQMARGLARQGWKVTLLDLTPYDSMPHEPRQVKSPARVYHYVKLAGSFEENNWYAPMQALCAYQWLKSRDFNCLLFQHGFGAGYFCASAKALNLAFAKTPLVVMPDNPYAFRLEKAQSPPTLASFRTDAEIDYFERMMVAQADGLLLTDKRALDWMQAAGWDLEKTRGHIGLLGNGGGTNAAQWLALLSKKAPKKPARGAAPLISVCVLGKGNAKLLDELLVSLRNQTLDQFEFIVMDKARGRDEMTLRNMAAKKAKGSHLLFLDEDDVLAPDAVEIFARAARAGTADILTSVQGKHHNSDNTIGALARLPPRAAGQAPLTVGWIYYGANLAVSPCVNVIGDASALIRRDVFYTLGGFRGAPGELAYARNLLLRAANKNYRIGVIPEVLILARRDKNYRHVWHEHKLKSELSGLAVLAENMPPALRGLLLPFLTATSDEKRMGRQPVPPETRGAPKLFASENVPGKIRIALCADEYYLTPACVTIASILATAKNPVDIVLITNASKQSLHAVQCVAGYFGAKITFIAPDRETREKTSGSMLWGKESDATYWRLGLPDYLPDASRVLYLDCDVIVRRDLGELWSAALGDRLLAAARDAFAHENKKMAVEFGGDYFNAGVLLLNLKQWRKQSLARKVMKIIAEMEAENHPYRFHEQSPLNKAVNGNWLVLPPTWNYYEGIEAQAHHLDLDRAALERLKTDAAICHFRAARKPWQPDVDESSAYVREYRVYLGLVARLMRAAGKGN